MLNDSRTLIDPGSVAASPPPDLVDDEELIGGRYRLLHPLGEGGMGNVYLAADRVLARQVAVKTVRAELSGNEEVRARIKRECRLHAAIGTHPHIITLFDTVEQGGHIYLVMEYFEGVTLANQLAGADRRGGLPLDQGLDIIRQILRALACIHGRDIVHRDIKTSNILLKHQADGRFLAKLTDFGIARAEDEPGVLTRLTALGIQGPGTPMYMAPERIDPQTFGEVGPASDLYAAGVILFELLAGKPPFIGTMTEVFTAHLMQPPAVERLPAGIPEPLRAIVRKALAKQPTERFQDAESFLAALADIDGSTTLLPDHAGVEEATVLMAVEEAVLPAVIAESTMLDPTQGQGRPRLRWKQPDRRWLAAAFALLLVLTVGLVAYRFSAGPEKPLTDPVADSAVATMLPQEQVISPPADADSPNAPQKEGSALEVVEQARLRGSTETVATTTAVRDEVGPASREPRRSASPARGGDEWQVMENRTRKIQ